MHRDVRQHLAEPTLRALVRRGPVLLRRRAERYVEFAVRVGENRWQINVGVPGRPNH